MGGSVLVRGGRVVGLDGEGDRAADVRVVDGVIAEIGPELDAARPREAVLDAAGCWLVPGLWDAHVHFGQWARSTTWIDVASATGPEDVCALVAAALAERPDDGRLVTAFGHRSAAWQRQGDVAELDAATGDRPVVVVSGDVHHGWLNSAAFALLGIPRQAGPLTENAWFEVFGHLPSVPGGAATPADEEAAAARLAALGLVGIVDLEFDGAFRDWPARVSRGLRTLRVRAGVYPHQLDEVVARGWRTGDPLPGGDGLVTMGPLKVISDGSLGTRTAWCFAPYTGQTDAGAPNVDPAELRRLVARAKDAGLAVAIHAIGDRANAEALAAFAATGASGSIEHAQLLRRDDVARFAELGVTASIQPHHVTADRDLADAVWADRTDRLFLARSLTDAGACLAMGSDAPVSPPDPWLTIAAAVHRSGDDRPGWHPEESLTPREALAASVDGQRLAPGAPGDLVVVGADPLLEAPSPAATAAHLRGMPVLATVCAGRVTHLAAAARAAPADAAHARSEEA